MTLPQLGSRAYHLGVRTAAWLGNRKATQWVAGRQDVPAALSAITEKRKKGQALYWMHAASLGEFEQGKPVFELLRHHHPDAFLVLTFFSPSGYEARKHYSTADAVLYLPEDTASQASWWVKALRPDLAIFVKYEFWPYHLQALHEAGIPTVLIAGAFRTEQSFFRWYGTAWRRLLAGFDQLIVQTQADARLLHSLNLPTEKVFVGGDPRTDRTLELARQPYENELLKRFTDGADCIIAGSVWPKDVQLFLQSREVWSKDWKLILAPHQLEARELAGWAEAFGALRYSALLEQQERATQQRLEHCKVLLLDTIGILSKVYRYGKVAYVGGGFGSGIHNTLEPMAYGLPVIFGPRFQKFPEAVESRQAGGGFVVHTAAELEEVLMKLGDPLAYAQANAAVIQQVNAAAGAAAKTYDRLSVLIGSPG